MSDKRGCLSLALGVALVGSLFVNLIFLVLLVVSAASDGTPDRKALIHFKEKVVEEGATDDEKIVLINLRGIISSFEEGSSGKPMVDEIKFALRQAVEDKAIKAIVLNIDSPGGEVTASDVIYNAVKNARAKKPVVIYMQSVAASGGYYVACGGTHLMASATTLTGSIGVIIQTLNYKDLFGKVGLQSVVFKSGKFKDMLNGAREMSEEEKAYVQQLVMQSYGRFVGIVAKERKLDEETLRNGVADGRILSGEDALQAKLVDEIGYEEDAIARAKKLCGATGASVVEYQAEMSLSELFKIFGKSSRTDRVKVELGSQFGPQLQPGRWYYMPAFFVP